MGRSTEGHTCADTVLKGDICTQICHQKDGHTGIQIHHKKNGHIHIYIHIHPMWRGWTHKNTYIPVHCQRDGHTHAYTQPLSKRWMHMHTQLLSKIEHPPNLCQKDGHINIQPFLKRRTPPHNHSQKDGHKPQSSVEWTDTHMHPLSKGWKCICIHIHSM